MLEILSATGLQNVCTPLPFYVHFGFCVVATLVYLMQYARKRASHYLIIMVAIDATFITQYCTDNVMIGILFGVEVVLLTLAGISAYKYSKAQKAAEAVNEQDTQPADSEKTE